MRSIEVKMDDLFKEYSAAIYNHWHNEFAFHTVMFYADLGATYEQIKEAVTVETIQNHLEDVTFYKDVYDEMIEVAVSKSSTGSGGFTLRNMLDQEQRRIALVYISGSANKFFVARHVHHAMMKYIEDREKNVIF